MIYFKTKNADAKRTFIILQIMVEAQLNALSVPRISPDHWMARHVLNVTQLAKIVPITMVSLPNIVKMGIP